MEMEIPFGTENLLFIQNFPKGLQCTAGPDLTYTSQVLRSKKHSTSH
ncbi:hypothetical protein SAMN05421827_11393 [Pedobacter terrae]|uniref:Uncharacterized protein n=1 Tax=Pedobacter terrae TaxID=405671 RepID=A0A1G7YDY6_9SPHI|nr:hypothetical protein SAMN05421827_11393 [Pedobacter terrae]